MYWVPFSFFKSSLLMSGNSWFKSFHDDLKFETYQYCFFFLFSKLKLIEPSTSELDVANLPVKISSIRKKMLVLEDVGKSNFVPVHRNESVEAQRSKLPIYAEEQSIMEAINDNCVCLSIIFNKEWK